MALEALSLHNTDFRDIPKSNEWRCDPRQPNALSPISYVIEGPERLKVITRDVQLLCLSGIHVAAAEDGISATRTLSPGFIDTPPAVKQAFLAFTRGVLPAFAPPTDEQTRSQEAEAFRREQEVLISRGNSLAGGIAAWWEEGLVRVGLFFPLTMAKKMGKDALRSQIALHSFNESELAQGMQLPRTFADLPPMPERIAPSAEPAAQTDGFQPAAIGA